MDVYVANSDGYGAKFAELCESLRVCANATPHFLLNNGFTNHDEPTLYYCRSIGPRDYHVSLNISIVKKTMEIDEICLLNDEILQPCRCDKKDYNECKKYIDTLIGKGILERA